eukprot:TRINITY_DN9958_c0_g1_i1.p1 TRINITY_DN9958_c0_g1~~TRINITY_DN9958_c0_g1_i1.p1  ORF type:complete len:186 (-),score=-7.29 TRINITY_DN9958_c0_g1_i1:259-816(-)
MKWCLQNSKVENCTFFAKISNQLVSKFKIGAQFFDIISFFDGFLAITNFHYLFRIFLQFEKNTSNLSQRPQNQDIQKEYKTIKQISLKSNKFQQSGRFCFNIRGIYKYVTKNENNYLNSTVNWNFCKNQISHQALQTLKYLNKYVSQKFQDFLNFLSFYKIIYIFVVLFKKLILSAFQRMFNSSI